MTEARDIIAAALTQGMPARWRGQFADRIISDLTAAGYPIAPPGSRVVPEGGVDAVTVERCAAKIESFSRVILKCDHCGDVRDTYIPGGCSGEATYRASATYRDTAALDGVYNAMRYFEKHICDPRQMEHHEIIEALAAALRALAEAKPATIGVGF